MLAGISPMAAYAASPKAPSEASNPFAMAMISVAVLLLVAIILVARLLLMQARMKLAGEKNNNASTGLKAMSVLLLCVVSSAAFAQDASADSTVAAAPAVAVSLSGTSFFGLLAVIGVELIILIGLLIQLRALMIVPEEAPVLSEARATVPVKKESTWKKLWEKANSFRPVKEEADIDLGHDYDGIRELDNRLPPWWLYGFYICIIFAGIYLWRSHVSHTAPSSIEEFQAEMKTAEQQKAAYLAKSKNNVDENTVKLLTDPTDIDAGKKLFTTACAACHGPDGGGIVGPNLVDDYWLHGGSVQDVFKTIKYGWIEKGMKSWKDDYSPMQIAQITSYVKSLRGSKPAAPKEPQGEIFEESSTSAPAADSSAKPEVKVTAEVK